MRDQLQATRIELKFKISEQVARQIRHYLGSRMRPDAHASESGYPVSSVYLDSRDAKLYGQSVKGDRNRYKLRVRVYDDDPSHPAFVEIKRRDGKVIKKQRAKVDRESAASILGGATMLVPGSGRGGSDCVTPYDWHAMREFCRLRDRIGAFGTTYVCYRREAYVSPHGTDWRATFDRGLSAKPYRPGEPVTVPEDCVPTSDYDSVVFELKFTNRFPNWMGELVRLFDLDQVSFPKYIQCADSLTDDDRRLRWHAGGPHTVKVGSH